MQLEFGYAHKQILAPLRLNEYANSDYFDVEIQNDSFSYRVSEWNGNTFKRASVYEIEEEHSILHQILNPDGIAKLKEYLKIVKQPFFDYAWDFFKSKNENYTICRLAFTESNGNGCFTFKDNDTSISFSIHELFERFIELGIGDMPKAMFLEVLKIAGLKNTIPPISNSSTIIKNIWFAYSYYYGIIYHKENQTMDYLSWKTADPSSLKFTAIQLPSSWEETQLKTPKFSSQGYVNVISYLREQEEDDSLFNLSEMILPVYNVANNLGVELCCSSKKTQMEKGIWGSKKYFENIVLKGNELTCDFYLGHHRQQYASRSLRLPASDSQLREMLTDNGIQELRKIIRSTNNRQEEYRWEYRYIKGRYTNDAYFTVKSTKDGYRIESSNDNDLYTLVEFVNSPSLFLNQYSSLPEQLVNEIREVVKFLGFDLPIRSELKKEETILFRIGEDLVTIWSDPKSYDFFLKRWNCGQQNEHNPIIKINLPTCYEQFTYQFDFFNRLNFQLARKFMLKHGIDYQIDLDLRMERKRSVKYIGNAKEVPAEHKEEVIEQIIEIESKEEIPEVVEPDAINPIEIKLPVVSVEEEYVSKTDILNYDWNKFEQNEDLHLFKVIGVRLNKIEFTEAEYSDRVSFFFALDENEIYYSLHIFKDAIYIYNNEKAKEIIGLPNMVIKNLLKITDVYVSKTKIVIQALHRKHNKEILIALDKERFEILEVKQY
jgi:hypothetical protein